MFDTAKRKISKNAADPAKKYGFTKQKHIRGDKTLNKYNFGPNVMYFVGRAFSAEASSKWKNIEIEKIAGDAFSAGASAKYIFAKYKKVVICVCSFHPFIYFFNYLLACRAERRIIFLEVYTQF